MTFAVYMEIRLLKKKHPVSTAAVQATQDDFDSGFCILQVNRADSVSSMVQYVQTWIRRVARAVK